MIEVRGLTKRYGDRLPVDDLTFDGRPGIVTGFLAPSSGSVTVNGRRYADHAAPLHEVGALLEARSVLPGLTSISTRSIP